MKIIKFFAILFLMMQTASYASIVKTKGGIQNRELCGIEFKNETSVFINIATITSISKQIYILPPLEVHEFVIDTSGNSQIRIYHTKHIDIAKQVEVATSKLPEDLAMKLRPKMQSLTEKVNSAKENLPFAQDVEKKATLTNVYKVYPTTTHAKTLEFSVALKEDFDDLYKQFQEAFTSNKSETLSAALFKEI